MCYLFKNLQNTSHFVTLFSAHVDVVFGFAIFHIVSFQKEKNRKKKRENGTPPWYVNVGRHPMESVSHGLRKEKRWGGVPSLIKEHKSANLSLKNLLHFVWKIVRTPFLVVDKNNHLSKPNFLSLRFTNEKL
jgi:hypothetical protein